MNTKRSNILFRTTQKDVYIRVHPAGNNPEIVDATQYRSSPRFTDRNPLNTSVMEVLRKEVRRKYSGLSLFAYAECHLSTHS
jgi:hypothetical protein